MIKFFFQCVDKLHCWRALNQQLCTSDLSIHDYTWGVERQSHEGQRSSLRDLCNSP